MQWHTRITSFMIIRQLFRELLLGHKHIDSQRFLYHQKRRLQGDTRGSSTGIRGHDLFRNRTVLIIKTICLRECQ